MHEVTHRGIVDAISVLKIEIFLYYYDPHTDPPPSTREVHLQLLNGHASGVPEHPHRGRAVAERVGG